MSVNPMMYRVFLQDEKDTAGADENPTNKFRISSGEANSWYYNCPTDYRMSIEHQLRVMGFGHTIHPREEQLDGHWLIDYNGITVGIVDNETEIADKSYSCALQIAENLTRILSKRQQKPYVFIDLTSRGNPEKVSRLANIVNNEIVETGCVSGDPALCADIGD